MIRRSIFGAITLVALSGAFFALQTPAVTTPAHAKYCYQGGQVWGAVASAIKKSKAQKRARKKWRSKAISVMGTSRAGNWDFSEQRNYHCHKIGIWYCRAYSIPCV